MITTTNRIKDKKPSRLMLLPMGILETFPCVKDVDYITRDLAVSSVRKNIMQISAQKQIIGPQESILRDELAFVHFRISTLETTLEDIQVHQNLLQSKNFNHQATILVVLAQQKHGRPITYKLRKSEYFIHPGSIRTGKILLAVIKMCGLGNKVGLVKGDPRSRVTTKDFKGMTFEKIEETIIPAQKSEGNKDVKEKDNDDHDKIINLQQWVVLVRQESSVDITPSVVKAPIYDWKIFKDKLREVYQIFRVGQTPKAYSYFEAMLKKFNNDDMVMFEPVATDGMIIYMLDDVEYPLPKTTLQKMLDHKCEAFRTASIFFPLLEIFSLLVFISKPLVQGLLLKRLSTADEDKDLLRVKDRICLILYRAPCAIKGVLRLE
ncbi:hypothetical protein Tco_0433132 [Tanacetum coccineum]